MTPLHKKKGREEENSFNRMMGMFPDADAIFLEDKGNGMVSGCPYNSKTGEMWVGMTLISSLEEAKNSKYRLCCPEEQKELIKAIS